MELTIHTGGMGQHNKINVDWFNEDMVRKTTVIEVEVLNVDKPRTIRVYVDGKPVAMIPAALPNWCEHISRNLSGVFCYNGQDVRQWKHCPKCGKERPAS